jgi:hypothetical protein
VLRVLSVAIGQGIRFVTERQTYGPYAPDAMVEIIGQSPAIGMPNFSKAGA